MAFSQIGCRVELVCPERHPARHARAVLHFHTFRESSPLSSVKKAISVAQPDLILSCDELARTYLHCLYAALPPKGECEARIRDVLVRSLGPAESQQILAARSQLIALARSEGVLAPEMVAVADENHLKAWLAQNGLPAVLKADGTSGGVGVQIISTVAEGVQALDKLSAQSTGVHAMKQRLSKRESTLLGPSLQSSRRTVNLQSFIPGRDATSSVACWDGQVVASISGEVLKTLYAGGPASVLRLIDHQEMHKTAEKLVKRLGLSGIYGFDFRLDARSGKAHLIEMNARATQISHLAMGTGRDLPVALQAVLSGTAIPPTKRITEKDIIALFPQEWNRDPASEFLISGYHDVPWREPELLKACVKYFSPKPPSCARAQARQILLTLHEKMRQRRR
jgi:biotin carboxylase